jgi:hypothetical protein
VSKARFILVALICASPAMLLWAGRDMQGLLAGVIALALAITAITLRPGETEFFVSVIFLAAMVAAVPALWIVFQVVPLRPLAHPIWTSAQSALGHTLTGEISVDSGATVIGLGEYFIFCALAFLSAAVAVDRGRAESLLFALTAAGATIALMVMTHDLLLPTVRFSPFTREQASDCIAMGAIVATAACIRTFERYRTRYVGSQQSMSIVVWTFAGCSVALTVCAVALLLDETREVLVATGCGLAALACVMIVRQFGLGIWGLIALAVPLVGAALVLFASQPTEHRKSLLLAFAASSPTSLTDISERILDDAPLVGTGAGTFAALAQIYREMDDPRPRSAAPTAAATFAIELGRPMLWLIVTATIGFLATFLKASLQRGRDSFYPAMGASCLISLLLLSFINAGVLGTAAALIAAVTFGVAIAQSKSRTMQR